MGSLGCTGQTVRPSLHSISQTSAGKLSILELVNDRPALIEADKMEAILAKVDADRADGGE